MISTGLRPFRLLKSRQLILVPNLVKRVVVTAFSVVNKIVEVTFVLELTSDNNLPTSVVSKLDCCFHYLALKGINNLRVLTNTPSWKNPMISKRPSILMILASMVSWI